jgi:hypothetical protein
MQMHITAQESNTQVWKLTEFQYIMRVTTSKDTTRRNIISTLTNAAAAETAAAESQVESE